MTIGQIWKISPFLKISYLVLNEDERKANRIITHEGENDEKVELSEKSITDVSHKQNHRRRKPQSGSKWKTYWLSAIILHS